MVKGGQQLFDSAGPLAYRHGVVMDVGGFGGGVGDLGRPGFDLGCHEFLGQRSGESLVYEPSVFVFEHGPSAEQRVTGC